eukprot:7885731-Pyramimonas_sp.AAC.1
MGSASDVIDSVSDVKGSAIGDATLEEQRLMLNDCPAFYRLCRIVHLMTYFTRKRARTFRFSNRKEETNMYTWLLST